MNEVDLVTFAQDAENAGVMRNLSVKWTDKTTGQEVQSAEEIGINDTYHFTGPATAGQYTFELLYTTETEEERTYPVLHVDAEITSSEYYRITSRNEFSTSTNWPPYLYLNYAIVGQGEDGKLYAMEMPGIRPAENGEVNAVEVTPDGAGHITLGSPRTTVFYPYHYAGAMRHYPRGNTDAETLLWDFGTGPYAEGTLRLSGGTVTAVFCLHFRLTVP